MVEIFGKEKVNKLLKFNAIEFQSSTYEQLIKGALKFPKITYRYQMMENKVFEKTQPNKHYSINDRQLAPYLI